MILVIDNYDSFTYNLVQYLGELGEDLRVFRNDKITPQEIERLKPSRIVISPGPGTPADAGITEDIIRHFHKSVPILGVCLGHQAIGEVFGGRIVRAPTLMLNGRYDFFYPTKISQEPMFRFLGASPEHKRRVVYDTGHNIPRPDMIKETLDWLDRYLGPVP